MLLNIVDFCNYIDCYSKYSVIIYKYGEVINPCSACVSVVIACALISFISLIFINRMKQINIYITCSPKQRKITQIE